ncbi:ABC transporter substrate-binding protein [Crossiella cryophila]|uniref:Peptide/nickel transport system substrate-binding protein n=1 Tax=Crossiella cryophila TaxID=43355 RepID=A0A7W7CCE7_9PSEU|nr:ABC transporter substrate-binding protein [Crossiella cryophila]MBB4677298.1 peptide/nickel transport system substrate-binding protein [Crossiella cryophila]
MRRSSSGLRAVASLLVLSVVFTGCSAGERAVAPADPNTVSIGFTAEPQNFDFTRTDGAAIPQVLLGNVYEGLVKRDEGGRIAAGLAESWTVSPDRTVYDFRLRPNVRFANGAPFSAEDVKFSLERVRTDWAVSLKSTMDVLRQVEVVSPLHARVVLSRPSNGWLFAMTGRVGAMFSPTGVNELGTRPVGTGPYEVFSRTRGDSIVLRAREGYWGARPTYTTVALKYFRDPTALNNALLSNGIDVIATVGAPDSIPQFTQDRRFTVLEGTTNGEVVLSFNNRRAPLSDVRVRRALTHAIDRAALLRLAWAGRGVLIGSMVPPTDPWFEDLTGVTPYDPDQARKLLREAGVSGLNLTLRIPNLPYAISSAQVIKSYLDKVGVTVGIEPVDFPSVWLKQVFTEHDFDLSIVQHVEARDIDSFGNPNYYWGYDNPAVRTLLDRADQVDPDTQNRLMREAARTIATDAAACWLFVFPNLVVARTKVTGLPRNEIGESFEFARLGRQ